MTRSVPWLVVSLSLVGCGGSTPAPETPAPAAAAPAPAADAPTAPPAASADKPAAEGWEGEGEAKDASTGAPPPPEAKPAPGAARGKTETRTIEVIQKIVKDHRQAVRDCYDKARKDIPSLQGDMMIHFVLDPDGKVKSIELNQERSTLKNPDVVNCAVSTIKGLTFPPSSRGMESVVNYPYNFMPGGPPPH
ncbi:MAG TPA: AgmX/PglI C-terminal domain-containing protein [Polyangiaceae bacterium]|nr:AgmX/PglI C-terminal domain-containing protein [Polyangiaceae bacterium]